MKRRIRWDRVLWLVCGLWLGFASIGAVRAAQREETEYLRQRLESANRFGIGAMEMAKREERKRREIERKLWLVEGRLPGVTE